MGRLPGRAVLSAHPSHALFWERYRRLDAAAPVGLPPAYHFCDNRADAQECLSLVLAGRKRATASALVEFEMAGDPLPQAGDYSIVTDFDGLARAVIRNESVTVRRLGDIDAAFAAREGEGDGTLEWWLRAHRAHFGRALAGTPHRVDDDLLIVCEAFELLFTS